MMLLLCPECCLWREPIEGRCPECSGTLDVTVADPTLDAISQRLGSLESLIGEAELAREHLPHQGLLYAMTGGLLFVPKESPVIVFGQAVQVLDPRSNRRAHGLVQQVVSYLLRRPPTRRFACERRACELAVGDRFGVAELLRSDPGVWFLARTRISQWRFERGRWEFSWQNGRPCPERLAMRHPEGDRCLRTWLEATLCPLSVTAH
jgi:hypothetical protein